MKNDNNAVNVTYNVSAPEYPTTSLTVDVTGTHPTLTHLTLTETYNIVVANNHNQTAQSTFDNPLVFLQTGQSLPSLSDTVTVNTSIFWCNNHNQS